MSVKITVDLFKSGKLTPVGCRICGGELVPALSAVKLGDTGNTFTCVGYSQSAGRYVACDGDGFFVSSDGLRFIRLADSHGRAFAAEEVYEGQIRAVMFGGTSCFTHTGTQFVTCSNPVDLYCGVMHCGRLFAIDAQNRYLLRWSASGVKNWEEGMKGAGSLVLDPVRGPASDILSYGGTLVIVRKYGLTVAKMYGSPENFSVYATDTDCDEIYEKTARTVLGRLYFYTASGLKYFDGAVIRGVKHRLSEDICAPACGEEYGGNYFLCCSKKTGGEAVLVYSPEDGESYFADGGADCMCACGGVRIYRGGEAFKLDGGGEYTLTAEGIDFGTDGAKTLLSLKLTGEGADVCVSNGRQSIVYKRARGVIRPRLRGRSFTVEVRGTAKVRSLTATAEAVNEI